MDFGNFLDKHARRPGDPDKTYFGFKLFYKIGSNEHMSSPLYTTQWRVGDVLEAECDNRHIASTKHYEYWNNRHVAPALSCNCGFHATWDLNDVAAFMQTQRWKYQKEAFMKITPVVAVVEAGGSVIQHDTGFRSQYATIHSLVAVLDVGDENFVDKVKSGHTLDLLREINFDSPWEIYNPGEAIQLVLENVQEKKE